MNIFDLFNETYRSLSANKVRSGLTILGIVIGISSVISMIAIGQGAQSSIQAQIQSIGSNLLLVMPGAQRGPGTQVSAGRGSARSLTLADATALSTEVSGVEAVAPELSGRYQITSKGQNTNTQVIGVTSAYPGVRNLTLAEGDFVNETQVRSLAKVAILGPTARDDLFGERAEALGQKIRIKGVEFKVVGILVAKGGSGFSNQDDMIYIPLSSAQKFLVGDDYLSTISLKVGEAAAMSDVQQAVTDLLLTRHHLSDPTAADFSIFNQADIVATASSITQTFTMLLAAVAGISLLVGGIGIMNMMLTTVTERTREIGLRKAIGAKKRDINLQFLAEATLLTFSGGFLGVVLGWGIAFGLNYFGVLATTVSLGSVLLAFGVSAGIGIIFGYYPARRAANLNPIEALRYE